MPISNPMMPATSDETSAQVSFCASPFPSNAYRSSINSAGSDEIAALMTMHTSAMGSITG